MSTYYLNGCKNLKPEILFFDKVYNLIDELIELDSKLQLSLEYHIVSEENIEKDINNYSADTSFVKDNYKNIINFIEEKKSEITKIEIFETNDYLIKALTELFQIFETELKKAIPFIIDLIHSEEISPNDSKKLNLIYPKMNERLDKTLNTFYTDMEKYAKKYHIELLDPI